MLATRGPFKPACDPPPDDESEGFLRFCGALGSSSNAECAACPPPPEAALLDEDAAAGCFGAGGLRGTGAMASTASDWQCSITYIRRQP